MRLVSNRQLTGVYGTVPPDTIFDCPDDIAKELLNAGKVRKPEPPRILETKVIRPPEVGPVIPFCNVPLSDSEPAEVVAESHSMLPESDLPEQRTPDSGGRRTSSRFGRKRK